MRINNQSVHRYYDPNNPNYEIVEDPDMEKKIGIDEDCESEVDKMKDKINIRNSGIEPAEAGNFLCGVKRMINNDLKMELSEVVYYPQKVVINGKWVIVNNKNDFVRNYSQIVNDYVKNAVKKQAFSKLFSTSSGIMIGEQGAIWVVKRSDTGKIVIFKINNAPPGSEEPANEIR